MQFCNHFLGFCVNFGPQHDNFFNWLPGCPDGSECFKNMFFSPNSLSVGGFSSIFLASLWIFGPGGRCRELCAPSCAPSCVPARRAYGSLAWEVGAACPQPCPQPCPQLCPRAASLRFFSLNSLPVGGFSRVSREPVVVFAGHRPRKPDVYRLVRNTMKDPPTQAVGNTSPLQKTPDMLRSRAAADTGMASQAKAFKRIS